MQYPWVSDVSEDNRDFLIEGGSCKLESFCQKGLRNYYCTRSVFQGIFVLIFGFSLAAPFRVLSIE